MDRTAVPAYLTAGAGVATALLGAVGVVTAIGWSTPSGASDGLAGGLAAAAIIFVLFLAAVALGVGALLSLLGYLSVREGWVRAPTVVLGGYLGVVTAAVAWSASSSVWFGGKRPVLGYGSILFPFAGLVAGWVLAGRLKTVETGDADGRD